MSFGEPPREDRGPLGPPPIQFRVGREQLPHINAARWLVIAVAVFVLFIAASIGKGIYADYLWFDSVGLSSVYGKEILTKVILFFASALIFLLFIGFNLWLARRLAPEGYEESFIAEVEPATLRRIVTIGMVAGSLFLAVIFGSVAAGQWDTVLRFANRVDFGVNDPAFNHDVGFYVFALPALRALQGWLVGAVIVTLLAVVGVYAFTLSLQNFELRLSRGNKGHVGALLIGLLLLFCFGYVLSIFELAIGHNGVVQGATYTDIHARVPGYFILFAFSGIATAAIVWSVLRKSLIPAGLGGMAWVIVLIVVLGLYPGSVQRFTVDPNELAKEQPYIERNIKMTRQAFGLDSIQEQPFDAETNISADAISANQETINNIRLWDPRFIINAYKQQQEIRPLYVFDDVDVDRYQIDNAYTEVTLSPRELTLSGLPVNARSWVNIHLQYTHGYGAVMNPVNKVDQDGLPAYNLGNIPPAGAPPITEPRVYYGSETNEYVIIGGKQSEFDYESDTGQAETRYSGKGGIPIGSFFRRLVYAWEFSDTNLLISGQITGTSRLLYRRNIVDRINHIAPFLRLDQDPYLVVAGGKLYWMQDAYTTSSNYPYSEVSSSGFNYIRNSVKVVVDAYTGEVTFYLADANDPIARTYQRMFPSLLKPISQMPDELRSHIRYPEDLFTIQADVFRTYHIQDARAFYNKEDLWATPKEGASGNVKDVVPYYVIMKLPGESNEEFVLIRPFTAANKPNAVAWMGARSDGENYGKLAVYRFPLGRQIPGPAQVDSSIDGQPDISQRFSLLNVQGSHVQRGNLLLIPISNSYLYVEPVYLVADQNPKPSVIGVIVYNGDKVYMEPTFQQALKVAIGQAQPTFAVGATSAGNQAAASQAQRAATPAPATTTPAPTPSPTVAPTVRAGPSPSATDVAGLAREALDADAQAQQALRQGDFAGYGQQQARLKAALDRLSQLVSQPTASPTP